MSFKDKILKNQSPWGSPPGGGGQGSPGGNGSGTRQNPPNLDDIIRNLQKTKTIKPIIIGLEPPNFQVENLEVQDQLLLV